MNNKVKIFICTHKPYDGVVNDVYVPLHIGKAEKTGVDKAMKDYVSDDTGENISKKGAVYSEGTGMYWIWKNVHDVEYVGINQYRRQFGVTFTEDNIDSYFRDGVEVLMVKKRLRSFTRWNQLLHFMSIEDCCIMLDCIKAVCPEYMSTVTSYANSFYDLPFNMIVCKKSLYDKYAEWVFGICQEMDKYIRLSPYSNAQRVMGYVLEFLTPVYFLHHKIKMRHLPYVFEGRLLDFPWTRNIPMVLLQTFVYPFIKNKPIGIDASIRRGLRRDGIIIGTQTKN